MLIYEELYELLGRPEKISLEFKEDKFLIKPDNDGFKGYTLTNSNHYLYFHEGIQKLKDGNYFAQFVYSVNNNYAEVYIK